jgi:hypothetical protein
MPNVELCEESLVDLLGRFDAVVTSSPSPTVTLTAAGQPFIKMRGDQPDGTCPCGERRVFSRLGEILDTLAVGVTLDGITSTGCEHNLTYPTTKESYLNEIRYAIARR